jgi:acetyl esterase/lipase
LTRGAALLLAAAIVVGGCGGSGNDEQRKLAAPFAYDKDRPFQLESEPTKLGGGRVEVRDVSFTGPAGGRLHGYLVTPTESGKHPAVFYAHGAGGDRQELLEQAVAMARRGAVSLTLTMRYSPTRPVLIPPGLQGVRVNAKIELDAVREVLRAVDLLTSLPSVDEDRIGFVGWSAGARTGAIVAGVDHRIRAFDLLAVGALPMSTYIDQAPKAWQSELEPLFASIDPLRYVGHAAPSVLLFQNGSFDEVFSKVELTTLARAGSEPKELRWYQTGHTPTEQGWRDSREWLADRLEL